MATRKIQNERLPKPTSSFTGSRHRSTVLGQGSGELGQNEDHKMTPECWDEWRDANGTFRGNCFDPLPDFE